MRPYRATKFIDSLIIQCFNQGANLNFHLFMTLKNYCNVEFRRMDSYGASLRSYYRTSYRTSVLQQPLPSVSILI